MLPFSISLRPGLPIAEQVVMAVTRAIVTGQLRDGDRFPSVRALSQALRINPNTAQRIASLLVAQGSLEIEPGIGSVVSSRTNGSRAARATLSGDALDPIVIEARRVGLSLEDLVDALRERWQRLDRRR